MKISEAWLKEFIAVDADAAEIGERLSFAGIEVAAVTPAIPDFQKVIVGKVESVAPHPSADKLKVCKVDIGKGGVLQIVCGAPNVQVGMKAPVILVGGQLPDGTVIKQAALRGVDSSGMLCSAKELGLSEEASGLMALPDDAPLGTDLRTYLGGDDRIIEIEITPNRGDCLGVFGIARELGALYDQDLKLSDLAPVPPAIKDTFPVENQATEACPVYGGRVIRGLRADAVTPLWMRERLRRAGLRSVNPAVDVTQYVMLELGQPMHAYDLKKLQGGIVVRMAKAGEKVKLLNGGVYDAHSELLVIADHARLQGIAGIMGGGESSVQAGSTDIFLEAANFTPATISGWPRRLDLQTDAAYRFERGVDPTGPARALERATQLLMQIAGGQPGPVTVHDTRRPAPKSITLRRARLAAILGIEVADREVDTHPHPARVPAHGGERRLENAVAQPSFRHGDRGRPHRRGGAYPWLRPYPAAPVPQQPGYGPVAGSPGGSPPPAPGDGGPGLPGSGDLQLRGWGSPEAVARQRWTALGQPHHRRDD